MFQRLILCLLFVGLIVSARGSNAPLAFTPAEVVFDRLPQQIVARAEVTVRNTTTQTVRVLGTQADCSCTTSQLALPVLSPGQTTTMTVQFESRNYSGKVTRHIQLETDAGTQTLAVHATVAPYADWDISPATVLMPPSLVEQIAQTEIAVRYAGAATGGATLTGVATNQPWLEANLLPVDAAGEHRVRLTKQPKAPPGSHAAVVTLTTTDAAAPKLTINVIVPVASSLRVAPSPVIMPRVRVGETARASFRLIGWNDAQPPQVTADGAEVVYVGAVNGELTFEVRLQARQAGPLIVPITILRADQPELEVKALATINP
ncbi:MAG: DUF1573 domain-containing protein [Opitutaceae bacterium]|nr:DUF1573 domain-containing protein [Opitutaceae bacterium]